MKQASNQKTIIIIGASKFQEPLIRKALELGYQVKAYSNAEEIKVTESNYIFREISVRGKELIFSDCRNDDIAAVVTSASDVCQETVVDLRSKLGVGQPAYADKNICHNKISLRAAFADAAIPSPKYVAVSKISQLADAGLSYPILVKPSDRSGSLGVTLVNNDADAKAALSHALDISFSKEAILEEYVDGKQISVESLTYNGQHYIVALTDEYFTGPPQFVERAHAVPADLNSAEKTELIELAKKCLDLAGINSGPAHIEVRLSREGPKIIEMASRAGGDFREVLIDQASGYDYTGAILATALGSRPTSKHAEEPTRVYIQWIIDQSDIIAFEKAQQKGEVIKTNIPRLSESDNLLPESPVTSSADRRFYFIALGDLILKKGGHNA